MSAAAALLAALLCGAAGLAVPQVIGRLPEPEPEPEPEGEAGPERPGPAEESGAGAEEEPEEKEPYAHIAALPGLRWKAAVAAAVVGALVGARVGPSSQLLVCLPLVPVGVALAVVDWRTRLLPTRLIAPTYGVLVVAALLAALVSRDADALVRSAIGWAVAGGAFFALWWVYPRGMGYGDVRLSGLLGIALANLGWGVLALGLWAGFALGGVGGIVLRVVGVLPRGEHPPFGPWMLLGAVVGVLWGERLFGPPV